MKRFTGISMGSVLLTMVLALPLSAQQPSRQGSSEPAGQQNTTTTPNVQQPRDSNTTTSQGTDTTSQDLNRQNSSSTGTSQPGPTSSSDYPGTTTSDSPNWVMSIVSLAIGLGIGYLLGRRRPGMHTSTGTGMPSPGRA